MNLDGKGWVSLTCTVILQKNRQAVEKESPPFIKVSVYRGVCGQFNDCKVQV